MSMNIRDSKLSFNSSSNKTRDMQGIFVELFVACEAATCKRLQWLREKFYILTTV